MRLLDQIRKDRKQLQELPDRQSRLQFIWDYYKIPILAVLFIVTVALIGMINAGRNADVVMRAVLLNSDAVISECDETPFSKMFEDAGVDMKGKKVEVNDKLSLERDYTSDEDGQTLQVIAAMLTMGDLDLFVADEKQFARFSEEGVFADLNKLIEKEILDRFADDVYRTIDSQGNEMIAGIVLHEDSPLHKAGYYHENVILGVVSSGNDMEEAIVFVKQFLSSYSK